MRRLRHCRDPALAHALSCSFALGAPQYDAPYVCTGADYMEEVLKRGRGHGLGAPYTHVTAAFVEALMTEAEGIPKQVLTTFMAHVAARQDTVTECFGAFRVKEAYSADVLVVGWKR